MWANTETNTVIKKIVTDRRQTSWLYIIQLIRERLSKKSTKVHSTRPNSGLGIHLNFAYWPRGNVQVCIFASEYFVFPLRRPFSVAFLFLSYVFEFWKFFLNSAWQRVPCFHMSEEKENVQICVRHVAILLVFSTCNSFLLLPILPFGLVACTFVLFSDNLSRISCIRNVEWNSGLSRTTPASGQNEIWNRDLQKICMSNRVGNLWYFFSLLV